MTVTGQQIVDKAMTQEGKPYIFGYEVDLDDPDPKSLDCSELVEWVCHQLGVKPTMPDGAIYQYRHCDHQGDLIDLQDAYTTPGALLFRIGKSNHVAISRGDGTTIEARGKNYGVGVFSTGGGRGFTDAALIPGVDYGEDWA